VGIKVLSPQTAAKIAAGEVIVRPASVVKELIENSLDAGAERIEVYLERGGKSLIRVTDDGEGIAADEAELTVHRFATSKLAEARDLERIQTYGFRGEALASIAEVSEMTIETQQAATETGVLLGIKAGKLLEHKDIVRTPGTTVTVRNLFFNLPARRSFLRSEPYERRLVLGVVRNYGLLHHNVKLKVDTPNQTLMALEQTSDWINRLQMVYPELKHLELIHFEEKHPMLSLEGVIIRPDLAKERQRIHHIFFNGRPVQYRSVYRAVIEGFGPQPPGQIPLFIIRLSCPAQMLDANIHPTKVEVRYRDERFLYDFLSQAVRKAMHKEAVRTLEFRDTGPDLHMDQPHEERQLRLSPTPTLTHPSQAPSPPIPSVSSVSSPAAFPEAHVSKSAAVPSSAEGHLGFWQLQNTYILAQTSAGLGIVDQHAAHERILYEEMLDRLGAVPRQSLLFPLLVDLNPEEFATFEEIQGALKDLGFEAKPFGPNQVIVETLPADAKIGISELRELFREFNETSEVKLGNRDKMAALIACKAAVKAGTKLSQVEMESLLNRLFSCKTPFFCPHGRPTTIKFSMDDLAKRFGRI
jgi:DNA mismatch repair protein MutL